MAMLRTAEKSACESANSTERSQIVATRCRLSPTNRAAAAKVICWHSISTSASNSRVKPESFPAHGGSICRTAPSGSRTRGRRTSRKHSCWKKFRCR